MHVYILQKKKGTLDVKGIINKQKILYPYVLIGFLLIMNWFNCAYEAKISLFENIVVVPLVMQASNTYTYTITY